MSDRPDEQRDEPAPEEDSAEPGVMGSLPRSRPSIRSPRRDEAAARRRSPGSGRRASGRGGGGSGPGEGRVAGEGPPPPPGAGLEDLARAGISAGVGAATFGLRLAGRAASAIRESLERR